MIQEYKELLLKDLCARLSYGVKIQVSYEECSGYFDEIVYAVDNCGSFHINDRCIEYIKPYLFPLSSMTEEQKEKYCSLQQKVIYNNKGLVNSDVMEYVNWCYKNHIDINNLIPMGLATDATGLNIY